jgi:hypothetical protein
MKEESILEFVHATGRYGGRHVQQDGGKRMQAALDVVEQRVVRAGKQGSGVGRFHARILPVLRRTMIVSACMFAIAQRLLKLP